VYQFIRANGGIVNWDIVLIEQVIDCKDKENLHKRERYYIEEKKAELNKCIPLRTKKEYDVDNKEYRKEYCENNKNKIAEKRKIYYEENKEKYNEYREENKEKYNEYQRAYYANKKNLN
jgi:hypothetical protein